MNNLKFFRQESLAAFKLRKRMGLRREAIPAPVDKDINYFFISFKEGDSAAIEIGNHLVTIKAGPNGTPAVRILTALDKR
jgi:hypothetical protein